MSNSLYKEAEELLKIEMMRLTEETRPTLIKIYRELAEQKQRIRKLTSNRTTYVDVTRKFSLDIEETFEDEDKNLLEPEPFEIESFQDFVTKRSQRMNKFYRDSNAAHQQYKETAMMLKPQQQADNPSSPEHGLVVTYADLKDFDDNSFKKRFRGYGYRKLFLITCFFCFALAGVIVIFNPSRHRLK
eukprot:CAMPEP_0176431788 /NCGR_PEP_ID=MMETSP0127-20121128/15008_1 /TAXON_ID=938130 /ORGANISM="Platyophrya macrostoma, Strain WH" /LENGTH=186 /DNA_ID=CAMNT_0017813837 /DNA_START=232 /DNA_END=792 /DNA_ORIENTATION=-